MADIARQELVSHLRFCKMDGMTVCQVICARR